MRIMDGMAKHQVYHRCMTIDPSCGRVAGIYNERYGWGNFSKELNRQDLFIQFAETCIGRTFNKKEQQYIQLCMGPNS